PQGSGYQLGACPVDSVMARTLTRVEDHGAVNGTGDAALRRWERDFPGRSALGQELVRRYGSVSRSYHDARHLLEVLDAVDAMVEEADDIEAVRLAAWFHDAVYDVRAPDNEERSAQLAESVLPAYDVDDATVAEVARLVRL